MGVVLSRFGAATIGLLLVLASARPVRAQTPPPAPWVAGISDEQKALAHERLEAGNALFLENKYVLALAEYERAVAAWDHPAIRFNIVRCLIQLERPVDAYDNLMRALRYGAAPLEEAVYAEARSYEKLLANEIGDIEVTCTQPATSVTLDGRPMMACPGTQRTRVVPGEHQLVATKPGFATRTIELVVLGGKHQHVDVALVPAGSDARIVHRWGLWMPWTVFGGGLVVVGFGALVELKASADFAAFDRMIQRDCVAGCTTVDTSMRDTARLENRVGVGMLVAGGAVTAVGAVLAYLNRARTVYPGEVSVRPSTGGGVVTWSRAF